MPCEPQPGPEPAPMPAEGLAAIAWAILKAGREIAEALDRFAEAAQRIADSQM
jgi:hypothetical protein